MGWEPAGNAGAGSVSDRGDMATEQVTQATERDEWCNLVGSDGKVKARLNRRTGELVIKERGEFHKWPILSLLKGIELQPQSC